MILNSLEKTHLVSFSVLKMTLHCMLCSTCGLAEELEQESKEKQKTNLPKSACGSVSIIGMFPLLSALTGELMMTLFVAVLPGRCLSMC